MQQKGFIRLYIAFLLRIRRCRQKQMTRTPSTTGSNLSDDLTCSYCHTPLPPQGVFCSSCGKQVEQKQNGELESDTELSSDGAQEQKAKTIRLTSPLDIYLKRWLAYQSRKNMNGSGRPQGSSPSLHTRRRRGFNTANFICTRNRVHRCNSAARISNAKRTSAIFANYLYPDNTEGMETDSSSFKLLVAYDYYSLCSRCWSRKLRVHRYSDTPDRCILVPFRLSWHGGGSFLTS